MAALIVVTRSAPGIVARSVGSDMTHVQARKRLKQGLECLPEVCGLGCGMQHGALDPTSLALQLARQFAQGYCPRGRAASIGPALSEPL